MLYTFARKRPCQWAMLATALFFMNFNISACRIDFDLATAWKKADVVVLGKAKEIKRKPPENAGTEIIPDLVMPKDSLIEVEETLKGKAEKEITVFDESANSTASCGIFEPYRYFLFLKKDKDVYTSILAINLSRSDEKSTRESIMLAAAYCSLKNDEEKREFIVEKFPTAPSRARRFLDSEAVKVKAKGLIPIYEKELEKDMPENRRLYLLGTMSCLGADTSRQLIAMLHDPEVHEKWNVIDNIYNLKNAKRFEPEIRKFVNDPDELTSGAAKSVLLRMGCYDVIPSLIRTARDSKNPIARINALYYFYWGKPCGKLPFTEEDIAIIKELQNSKDESVARVAKFIIKDLEEN